MVDSSWYVALSAVLFTLGVIGVVIRDHPIVDGQVWADSVISRQPAWVAVYPLEGDQAQVQNVLGWTSIDPDNVLQNIVEGLQDLFGDADDQDVRVARSVAIDLNESGAAGQMFAALNFDAGERGTWEYPNGGDTVITFNDMPVGSAFRVVSHFIDVDDQRLDGNELIIDRVVTQGAGWLAAYSDEGGQPGQLIGQTQVGDGVSDDVRLEIDESLATPVIHVMLYTDASDEGNFDPNVDTLAQDMEGQPMARSFWITPPMAQVQSGQGQMPQDQSGAAQQDQGQMPQDQSGAAQQGEMQDQPDAAQGQQ
jgi:hypothetical protein